MLRECAALASKYNLPVHTHLAETSREVEEHRLEYGMPVVPWIKKQGLLERQFITTIETNLDRVGGPG